MVLIVLYIWKLPCYQEFISITFISLASPTICAVMHNIDDSVEEICYVRFETIRIVNKVVYSNHHEDY